MYSLSSAIFHTPCFSIRPKPSFPNPKPISLATPLIRMDNTHLTAANSTSDDSSSVLVGRRDLLALGVAAVALPAIGAEEFPIKLTSEVSRVVGRPKKSRSKKEKDEEEEVLVIGGIEFDRGDPVKFDVYVNDDDVGDSPHGGPDTAEFAGTLVNVPHGQGRGKSRIMRTCLRLGISELLESVGADDDDTVVVTLVPRSGDVTVGSIGIELLA